MKTFEVEYPLTNDEFLKVLSNSFSAFLDSGTSRSTAKLKPLHGAIAKDLSEYLGKEYTISSQGFGDDREKNIQGRYYDKRSDITVSKGDEIVAGIAVKFVMQNYSQNSNNYFEGMLGETANIRSNGYPYFQILIIFDHLPYYSKSKNIEKWEEFDINHESKYVKLSQDNTYLYFHTPNKTLIYIIHVRTNDDIKTKSEYEDYYKTLDEMPTLSETSTDGVGNSVIINDYEKFREKVFHTILSL